MAIDFDELNNFLRKSPMILSQADVLDWSETMTNDVKTKIHDGLKAGASYFAAEHGYGLDKLINDEEIFVRGSVAKQGYGLDILIDDNNRDVRMTVAHQGYGLDKLINDDYWGVRAEIANQGYGLDKLIHDEEPKVRLLAYDALRAEEEQQKSNQQGKRRVLFVQDNYDDEIENSEFDFDV